MSDPLLRPNRPLLLTGDPQLLDELLRCAAAAGIEPEVHADPGAARRGWSSAPLILLGRDLAARAAALELPRRSAVILVTTEFDEGGVWEVAFKAGCEQVVHLPADEGVVIDRLWETTEQRNVSAATVCVLGGRGGAGATTLAVALALTGTRHGSRAMLVDGDPLGGGIDLTVGGEGSSGLRWPDLAGTRGRVDGAALTAALPSVDRLSVLSWDRGGTAPSITAEAMDSVLAAARRSTDLVVIDLPRRIDPASEVALGAADITLLVCPAEVRATAAAGRVAAVVGLLSADLRVVVRGPAPSDLPASVVAEALGLPLAGWLRAEPRLAQALENGQAPGRHGRGPLAAFCGRFLREVIERPRQGQPAA